MQVGANSSGVKGVGPQQHLRYLVFSGGNEAEYLFFFSSCVQILWLYVKVRRDRVRRWVHVCQKREKKGRGKREDRLGR